MTHGSTPFHLFHQLHSHLGSMQTTTAPPSAPSLPDGDSHLGVAGVSALGCSNSVLPEQSVVVMAAGNLKNSRKDLLMLDSGAQVCCCPEDFAPEIPMIKDDFDKPKLTSVTGDEIKLRGFKIIKFHFQENFEITIKFYVTNVTSPVVSAGGLTYQPGHDAEGKCLKNRIFQTIF